MLRSTYFSLNCASKIRQGLTVIVSLLWECMDNISIVVYKVVTVQGIGQFVIATTNHKTLIAINQSNNLLYSWLQQVVWLTLAAERNKYQCLSLSLSSQYYPPLKDDNKIMARFAKGTVSSIFSEISNLSYFCNYSWQQKKCWNSTSTNLQLMPSQTRSLQSLHSSLCNSAIFSKFPSNQECYELHPVTP